MIHFSVFEDTFPKLYKWLMQTYRPNMEGFTDLEGLPSFCIDPNGYIYFRRDFCSLPKSIRFQTLDNNAKIEAKLDGIDSYIAICTSKNDWLYLELRIIEE